MTRTITPMALGYRQLPMSLVKSKQRVADHGEVFTLAWLVEHPEAGKVLKASGGCRKVRWMRPGTGKCGGVRIIHYNRLADGVIYLLLIYAKGTQETIAPAVLKKIRETIDGEDE